MKFTKFAVLGLAGLALSPVNAIAAQDDAEAETVDYDAAMQCSALFSLLSSASEGEDESELQDMAARWLVVAMDRDGTEDGSKAEAELSPLVDELIATLEDAPDEAAGEEFLNDGVNFCEQKHEAIAEEIDAIELE